MFKRQGRRRELGLGSIRDVSLSEARQKAAAARRIVDAGKDPLEERRAAEAAARALMALPTFGMAAETLIDGIAAGFRNAKHLDQWRFATGARGLAAEIGAGIVGVMSDFGAKIGIKAGFTKKPDENDLRANDPSEKEKKQDGPQKDQGDDKSG